MKAATSLLGEIKTGVLHTKWLENFPFQKLVERLTGQNLDCPPHHGGAKAIGMLFTGLMFDGLDLQQIDQLHQAVEFHDLFPSALLIE